MEISESIKPEAIKDFIDKRILNFIDTGRSFTEILKFLNDKIIKYCNDDQYIRHSVLILNFKVVSKKSKFMHFYVIHCRKRIADINWANSKGFNIDDAKLFRLILLRDKLSKKIT
jgi:hypothetical protein